MVSRLEKQREEVERLAMQERLATLQPVNPLKASQPYSLSTLSTPLNRTACQPLDTLLNRTACQPSQRLSTVQLVNPPNTSQPYSLSTLSTPLNRTACQPSHRLST